MPSRRSRPRRARRITLAAACAVALAATGAQAAQAATGPLRYVALGDSYSAASGVLPPDPSAAPECARSIRNYPHVIAGQTGAQLTDVTCGGAEIHGWVTGVHKMVNVELFLNNTVLGAANLTGTLRNDVSSTTPVLPWRVNVNLDATARGDYQLRAIATDALGNRRQFAMKRVFFNGPGQNCTNPRRRSVR